MTLEELQELDNYGHKPLEDLTKEQLEDYLALLTQRASELTECIRRKKPKREDRREK